MQELLDAISRKAYHDPVPRCGFWLRRAYSFGFIIERATGLPMLTARGEREQRTA